MFKLFVFTFSLLQIMTTSARADDPIVFISAFATGEKGGIHAFQFDSESGKLKPLHRTPDISNPFFLAISPDQKFLYSIETEAFGSDEDEFVTAFSIDGRTGKLKRINQQSARGSASCYLDVNDTGKTVVVANYSSGSVASLPVKKDGSIEKATSFIQHEGSSVNQSRQQGPKAHSIVFSPDNRFVLAADLGIDKIMCYSFDAATGKLSPNEAYPFTPLAPGSGPRHLIFHLNGKRVYVINELLNTVTFFDYKTDSGQLTERQTIPTLPADFAGTSHTADLKITPDGRFLYGTNRGHDSIACYRIGDDGMLELLSIEPSLGKGPQNLLITPDGGWLICANMPGNNVAVFQINSKTGALTKSGEPISMPMPSCIRWVD